MQKNFPAPIVQNFNLCQDQAKQIQPVSETVCVESGANLNVGNDRQAL